MEKILHILIHAFKDTIVLLPFLLIVYLLIELLEYKNVFKFKKSKLLTGKLSPLVGGCFGVIPQCGFSVISAELFSEKKMSISALIAVFLATSDEAFPILISNYKSIPALIALLLSKFIIAVIVGYIVMFITNTISKKATSHIHNNENNTASLINSNEHNDHGDHHDEKHDENDEHQNNHAHLHACCHHDIEDQQKFNWKHPIIHSIKITFYIFIINAILGSFFELVGEDNISNFLASSFVFQPILTLIIGFIPNCASSVIITELFVSGQITFGSVISGLCANAGLGLFVLLKNNKNIKENIFIIATIIITSLIFGYIFHFIPLNFLKVS